MCPWFVGVCTSALWGYGPVRCGPMRPCFTALRVCRHEPGGLVFGDDRSSDSRSRFPNKEDVLRRALSSGTGMARLRSSCNASHVRPKNRAVRSILAKCNSENIHKKNRLRINKDVKSPKQSGKRGWVQGRERKPRSDGVSSPSLDTTRL